MPKLLIAISIFLVPVLLVGFYVAYFISSETVSLISGVITGGVAFHLALRYYYKQRRKRESDRN